MTHSETIQKFALQGPFSVPQLLLLGFVLASLLAYLAWRWARDSGSWRKSAFLLFLRLGALAVALWMLAGASTVTLRRDTRAKSVLFMVDSSASMGLVDPVDGSGETVRWTPRETRLRASPPVPALDEVLGTLQSARSDATRLRLLTESGDPARHGPVLWEQIHHSVDAAAAALDPLLSPVTRADADAGAELGRVAAFLKDNAGLMGSWKRSAANPLKTAWTRPAPSSPPPCNASSASPSSWPPPTKKIPPTRTSPAWPWNPGCQETTRSPPGSTTPKTPG